VFFSLETSIDNLLERMVFMLARVDGDRVRGGQIYDDEYERLASAHATIYAAEDRFHLHDASTNVTQAIAKIKSEIIRHPVGLVLLDYLQILEPTPGRRSENRNTELQEITNRLKSIPQDYGIPLVAATQLSRAMDKRTGKEALPKLSDLREGGNQEAVADKVIAIHNPIPTDENEADNVRNALLIVLKHKNGKIGKVPVMFNPTCTRFEDRDNDHYELPASSGQVMSAAGFVPKGYED
jgi:replicative DNA helicase